MNSGTRLHNYILFAVSFVAAIWFFVAYPAQDPHSAAKVSFSEKEIELKAAEKFSSLGFSISDYTISDVSFTSKENLLDSLQYQKGRPKAVQTLKTESHPNINPFYWQVVFERESGSDVSQNEGPPFGPSDSEIIMQLDESGQFMALVNPAEHLPNKKIQREALRSVFAPAADSLQREVMTMVSDSLLSRLFYFDLQKEQGKYADYQRTPEAQVRNNLNRGFPYRHSKNDARALAEYYLKDISWNTSGFRFDTVFVKRVGSINAANVRYSSSDTEFNQQLQIDVIVAPTGALLQFEAVYNPAGSSQNTSAFIWEFGHIILIFGLGLTGLVVFFFRMRSRAIDTQSALIIAIVMGLSIPLMDFLKNVGTIDLFASGNEINETLILFLRMGIYGALSSVGYFILFAISDSITRQHWPQKLLSYDYLRQGMIFNKPVGIVLLRGLGLSFVLAGFWTLVTCFLPELYFAISSPFLSDQAAWSPLFMLLDNAWFSFVIVLAVFTVIGSQAYGKSKNPWIVAIFIILACSVFVPINMGIGPPVYYFLAGALLGIPLAYIYIQWDFLTLLISHFLFLGLMGSASGWTMPNSPDSLVFIFYIILMIVLAVLGCLAIFIGKEERTLPEYVPGYVEELAQEQRIKQELQIAREVQQSFLPSKIPAVPGLDIAAVCQPAYETGGDYYDYIQLDDHRVAVAIGDVSGKGIQAAFYMTFVKGMLHSLCHETDSPAEVLRKANRLFYENASKGTFISLIYGVVDLQKKTFTFARAGHNPILHTKIGSGSVLELQPSGLGIGLTKGEIFDNKIEEIKLSITEDDLFLFYTDGIVEALNQAHQFYGTDNLIALVKKEKSRPASQIVSAISKGVTRFIGSAKQHDDMTLMAIRFSNIER